MDKEKITQKIRSKYNGMPLLAAALIIVLMIISGQIGRDSDNVKEEQEPEIYEQEQDIAGFEPDEDIMNIYGIKEIKIDEGSTLAELYYLNPEQNADRYYMTVSITLKGSGELLYSSDLLLPGRVITSAEFSRSFEKGIYKAVFHVQGVKMNDFSSVKGADFDIDIIVE